MVFFCNRDLIEWSLSDLAEHKIDQGLWEIVNEASDCSEVVEGEADDTEREEKSFGYR